MLCHIQEFSRILRSTNEDKEMTTSVTRCAMTQKPTKPNDEQNPNENRKWQQRVRHNKMLNVIECKAFEVPPTCATLHTRLWAQENYSGYGGALRVYKRHFQEQVLSFTIILCHTRCASIKHTRLAEMCRRTVNAEHWKYVFSFYVNI